MIEASPFSLENVHISWKDCIDRGLAKLDRLYLSRFMQFHDWLPGPDKIFNAFSLPISKVNYVLFGESPYPRAISANGYAFWDAAVQQIWSETGLSKAVNRATSLRHFIKMLLVAEKLLNAKDVTQAAISRLSKKGLIETNNQLFQNLLRHGFLLLNTTPVLTHLSPQKDAKAFRPFMREVLACLLVYRPDITFIFFGNIAKKVNDILPQASIRKIFAEHPYNHSFVTNKTMIDFFEPFHLLMTSSESQ